MPSRDHSLSRPHRISQRVVFFRLFRRHNVRILRTTPNAPDTLVLQRLEPAESSSKDPVDARSTKNDFLVELVLESLMHQHGSQPHFLRAYIEPIRNLVDMRGRFGFYSETLIFRGLDGFSFQV